MTMTGTRWLKALLANFSATEHRRRRSASAGSIPSALEEKLLIDFGSLTCPICYLTFIETPKVLPCGHSICSSCLKGLSTVPAPRDRQCPLCRGSYKPDVLPKNYALESVLDAIVEEVELFYRSNELDAAAAASKTGCNCDDASPTTTAAARNSFEEPETSSSDAPDSGDSDKESEKNIVKSFAQSNLLFDYNRLKLRVESMNQELREIKLSEKELRSLKFREMTFRELKDENKTLKATVNSLQLLLMFLVALCAYFLAKSVG